MVRYICTHCGFRCNLQKPTDCPYCGKDKLEAEKSASELLGDIDKVLEE